MLWGTRTAARTVLNTASRPANRYLASANPAAAASSVATAPPTPAYSAELSTQRR